MLRIGTDCSGIEAPIQALQKLNVDYTHVFCSDTDNYVIESIKANYRPKKIFGDITKRNIEDVPDIDIYVCGFPCQAFSLAGNRKGFQDPEGRGIVFFSCLKVIKRKMPKLFVLENVKGLLNHDKGKTFKRIMEELGKIDYDIHWKMLNTCDYGIPQNRERIFIIGFKGKKINKFKFPAIKPMKNIHKYIDKNDNTSKTTLPPRISKSNYMSKIPKNSIFIDFSLYSFSNFPNADKKCSCICRQSEFWCVPKNRSANCKELLSLQGFPTNFKQVVSNTQMKRQIGNSMSVNVLKELFRECLKYI